MTEYLTSLKNPRIQAIRALKERKERLAQNAFLVEGDKMVAEALASSFPVRALILREDREAPAGLPEHLPVYVLPERVCQSLSDTRTPQGIAAVVGKAPSGLGGAEASAPERSAPPVPGARLIALDGVQDPGNVGTILRTADAAGLDGALLSPDCADVFSPKTLRATMGSVFRVPLEFPEHLASRLISLREAGYAVLSSQLDGMPFYQRPDPGEKWVLIIGNEGNGVSPDVRAAATHRLRLPMRGGAESLNAAVAAGIMMYELMRE